MPNVHAYVNAAYDKAYEAMRFMPDGAQRLEYIRTMNALIKEDVSIMLTYDTLRVGVLQNWVGNFERNLLLQEHMYLSVDIVAKRKGLQ